MKYRLRYWALATCILAPLGAGAQEDSTVPPAGFVEQPVEYVDASRYEIYKDFNAWWGENKDESILQSDLGFVKGLDYGVRGTAELADPSAAIPSDTEVVLITSNSNGWWTTRDNVNSAVSQSKLRAFVQAGGILVVHLADNDGGGGFVAPGIASQSYGGWYGNDVSYVAPSDHPLSMGPDGLAGTADDLTNSNIQWRSSSYVHHNYLQSLPSTDPASPNYDPDVSNVTVLATTYNGRPLWAEWNLGYGLVIASDLTLEFGNDGSPGGWYGFPRVALRNELFYATHFDRVAPTTTIAIDPAPPAGTWSNVPVTVTLTAVDNPGGSGVARIDYSLDGSAWTEYTGPFVVSTDGHHSVSAFATDRRGNAETPGTAVTFDIDATAPAITITTPAEGDEYFLNAVVLADWSVTDPFSGVASASGTVAPGQPVDTSSVGGKTFSVTAVDYAGNTGEALTRYSVRYSWCGGFGEPLNADGSSVFRQGSTVPVKFQLCDASGALQSGAIAELYLRTIAEGVASDVNEAISTSAATEGNLFRYDAVDQQYIFNLSTKTLDAGVTYELIASLDDGSVHTITMGLR